MSPPPTAQLFWELLHWCNLLFCLEQKKPYSSKFRPFNLPKLKKLKVKRRTCGLGKAGRLGVWSELCELLTFGNVHWWTFPFLKTTCSDVQSLSLWRAVFPPLWIFLHAAWDYWLLSLCTSEKNLSLPSLSSFSIVKDTIRSPLDHLFSGQHKPISLSLFFYVIRSNCATILGIHFYSRFVAFSHVGGPHLPDSAQCVE